MTTNELGRAFDLIKASSKGDFAGEQPEERIDRAEQALGLSFPPTYREFVKRMGCGDIFGEEFFGIVGDDFENSCVPNGIWLTLEERRTRDLPYWLILVGDTGDGGYYAIDVSQKTSAGESPVVEWWSGTPPFQRTVAEDFGTFLWDSIRAASAEQ
jgi:antitoxin YobK